MAEGFLPVTPTGEGLHLIIELAGRRSDGCPDHPPPAARHRRSAPRPRRAPLRRSPCSALQRLVAALEGHPGCCVVGVTLSSLSTVPRPPQPPLPANMRRASRQGSGPRLPSHPPRSRELCHPRPRPLRARPVVPANLRSALSSHGRRAASGRDRVLTYPDDARRCATCRRFRTSTGLPVTMSGTGVAMYDIRVAMSATRVAVYETGFVFIRGTGVAFRCE